MMEALVVLHRFVGPLAWLAAAGCLLGATVPVVSIDLMATSPAFVAAKHLLPRSYPLIEFVGEDLVAVSALDGFSILEPGQRKTIHHTVEVYRVNEDGIRLHRRLVQETDTIDSKIAATPSGQILVNNGRALQLLDPNLNVLYAKSAEDICELPRMDDNETYRVSTFIGSAEIAILSLAIGSNLDSVSRYTCWFSLKGLQPLQRAGVGPATLRARGMKVISANAREVTVEGMKELDRRFFPGCKPGNVYPTLAHAEPKFLYSCEGSGVGVSDGQTTAYWLRHDRQPWAFDSDAWNAPIAVFRSVPRIHVSLAGNISQSYPEYFALNYVTGAHWELPLPDDPHTLFTVSLSASGKRVAVLDGGTLKVYDLSGIGL